MVVLSCKNIHKSYGIKVVLENVTFNINEGDKIGLIGPNGAGKSTLFNILTNKSSYDSGDLYIDKSKNLGYLTQHLSLNSSNTIYKEMYTVFKDLVNLEKKLGKLETLMSEPYDSHNEEYHNKLINDYTTFSEIYKNRGGYTYKAEINKTLKGLGFSEEEYSTPIDVLSGGKKTRVALCKLLLIKPDILLLDEPTNHLDLESITALNNGMSAFEGTMMFTSHDHELVSTVANRIIEITPNGFIDKMMPYDDYLQDAKIASLQEELYA